jgi:nucleotide-binding universal stress UspA family protein
MKIILATDGSQFSEIAARTVAAEFKPETTQILILSIVEARGAELGTTPREFFENASQAVRREVRTLVAAGFRTNERIIEADSCAGILDAASEWGADLIVLGSHGHPNLRKFFLGSVAEDVVHNAHCSVLIVRVETTTVTAT